MKVSRIFRATVLWTIVLVVAVVLGGGCKKKESPATPAKEMSMEDMQKQAIKTVEDTKKAATAASVEQTMCPVMEGNKIDKNVFVEYKGKKVYFCCAQCKAAFEKEPEKYLAKLPQFAK
ncbi:MAG: YHS domain-containing protein [Sedimentisphaerales bacterium]|jgi:YHS domain-containing protein